MEYNHNLENEIETLLTCGKYFKSSLEVLEVKNVSVSLEKQDQNLISFFGHAMVCRKIGIEDTVEDLLYFRGNADVKENVVALLHTPYILRSEPF